MPAQDDARENRIVDLFNLDRPANRVRHGTDAILEIDGRILEFELKSTTIAKGGISTVRDLGKAHIEKWREKHWIIGIYSGDKLLECKYGTPDAMAPWIDKVWTYIAPDFEVAEHLPPVITEQEMIAVIGDKAFYSLEDAKKLHKLQYSAAEYRNLMDLAGGYSKERMLDIFRDRAKYLIERGSTLNNPKITPEYFMSWPSITKDHAGILRELIRAWLVSQPPASTSATEQATA
ncbi:PDDEXK family nuclease [Microvirga roseola]|uniref:hypothetical protein n=1 Tax=Microvirga roseola TaxID=2883126 RepID=UPI001E5886B9|nr:hypothetical protein [Microvirga roseola]